MRKVDALLELEAAQRRAMDQFEQRLLELDRRVARMENREDIVLSEAKSAARTGAQDVMTSFAADLVRRVTLLEAGDRVERLPGR